LAKYSMNSLPQYTQSDRDIASIGSYGSRFRPRPVLFPSRTLDNSLVVLGWGFRVHRIRVDHFTSQVSCGVATAVVNDT
jgi:hypothetical protein